MGAEFEDYGGVDRDRWAAFLGRDNQPLRLFAMRVCALNGAEGARLLLAHSLREGETYCWIWALSRCARLEDLPAGCLIPRVKFLLRRKTHVPAWVVRRDREECREAFVEASHPQQILACAVRLLELHGERAIPVFLEFLRHPPGREDWEEKAECAAWALGTLGRAAVPEIVQALSDASLRVRRHLSIALWYMGPEAARAVPALLKHDSLEGHSALLALESAASRQLVAQRLLPVWLDEGSICDIAMLAFGDDLDGRLYATTALAAGSGTQLGRFLPILRTLARDPEARVRLRLAESLKFGGSVEGWPILLDLLTDADGETYNAAREAVTSLLRGSKVSREALVAWSRQAGEAQKALVPRLLNTLQEQIPGNWSAWLAGPVDQVKLFLETVDPAFWTLLLAQMLNHVAQARPYADWVVQRLTSENSLEVRRQAAYILARMGHQPEALKSYLWDVLSGPDYGDAVLAGQGLIKLGEGHRIGEMLNILPAKYAEELIDWLCWEPELLERTGRHLVEPMGTCHNVLRSQNKSLRYAVIRAVWMIRDRDLTVKSLLIAGMDSDNPVLALACDDLLGREPYQVGKPTVLTREILRGFGEGRLFNKSLLYLIEQEISDSQRVHLFFQAWLNLDGDQRKVLEPFLGRLDPVALEPLAKLNEPEVDSFLAVVEANRTPPS